MQPAINIPVKKIAGNTSTDALDIVTTEEPLEIRLSYGAGATRVRKSVSVTMRTPGNDEELAMGFLYTEGIIQAAEDVSNIAYTTNRQNIVEVTLDEKILPNVSKLDRNFYTTSSCGVCGKSSIEAVRITCNILDTKDNIKLTPELVYTLPDILRKNQDIFEHTGGIHACALFDTNGALLLTREDAGRHNALDKLIGAALKKGMLPLNNHILLLSGRTSFELVQKAAMAGIKIIAAVGAPSSLAVQLADEWGMTLIGFLRGERFNIYTGAERIKVA